MPIPDSIRTEAEAHLDQYCVGLIPKHVQDKIRIGYVAKGMAITLFEQRPGWKDKTRWTKSDIARIKYNKTDGEWTLYLQGQEREMARLRALAPDRRLRGGASGDQVRSDRDFLGMKTVGT